MFTTRRLLTLVEPLFPLIVPCRASARLPARTRPRYAAQRQASTQFDPPAHSLKRLILTGKPVEILNALERGGIAALQRSEARDILCRLGDPDEGEDLDTRGARKRMLGLLDNFISEHGYTLPDATLMARAAARVPWAHMQITDFLRKLRQSGSKPNATVYEHLMNSLLRAMDSKGAEQLLIEMEVDGVRGTAKIYGSLAEVFVNQGRKEALERLLKSQK